jgi:hypothetical protein
VRAWLLAAGIWALLALHAFSDPRPPNHVWGVIGMLALHPATRAALLGAAALVATPPLSRWLARALSRVKPLGRSVSAVPPAAWIALLVAFAWLLRSQVLYGDGAATADQLVAGELINAKEPLDRLVTALVFRAGYRLTGWAPETAMALVSTLAGALFWAAVLRLGRLRPLADIGAASVWLLVGSIGTVEVFFGHVENYALLTAGTLWALTLALEATVDPRRSLYPASLVTGLTLATHLSAAWLVLVLPTAWWHRHWGRAAAGGTLHRRRWPAMREAALGAIVAFLPLLIVMIGMAAGGTALSGFSLTNFGGGDGKLFVPLFKVTTPYEVFTMFSAAHLRAIGNELLLVAPAGLLLALVAVLGRRSDGRRADAGTWVLLAAAAGLFAYAWTFNPDMMVANPTFGPLNEWDLFAFEAVPLTLLGLWSFHTAYDPGEERDGMLVAACAFSLVHTVPWLLFNAGVRL